MGFGYSEFSKESLDLRQLQDLYKELNLPVTNTSSAKPALPPVNATNTLPAKPLAASMEIDDPLPASVTSQPARDNRRQTTSTFQHQTSLPLAATASHSSPIDVANVLEKVNIVNAAIYQNGQLDGAMSTDLVTSKEDEQKLPDRKEYIARLMAAKSKKSQAQEDLTTSEPPSPKQPALEPSLPEQPALESSSPKQPALESLVIPSPSSEAAGAPHLNTTTLWQDEQAKKKAKTELIRLRIEALKAAKQKEAVNQDASAQPAVVQASNEPTPLIETTKSIESTSSPRPEGLNEMIETIRRNQMTTVVTSSAPSNNIQTSSAGGIPGLFMTSPSRLATSVAPSLSIAQSLTSSAAATPPLRLAGKRLVADDFDDGPSSKVARGFFGRRTYHDEQEGVIIEVSEDDNADNEDDGSLTDCNEISPNVSGAVTPAPTMNGLKTLALPDRPLSRQTGNQRAWQASNQHVLVPTAETGHLGHLRHRETKIAEMRRKIAEMELKKKAKALASRASSPSTHPEQINHTEVSRTPASGSGIAGSNAASNAMENKSLVTAVSQLTVENDVSTTQRRSLAPVEADAMPLVFVNREGTPKASAPELVEESPSDLGSTDDNTKLQALLAQVEELQTSMKRKEDDRVRLAAELESVGVNMQGMLQNDLQATRDEIALQRQLAVETSQDTRIDSTEVVSDANVPESKQFSEDDSESMMSIDSTDKDEIKSSAQDELLVGSSPSPASEGQIEEDTIMSLEAQSHESDDGMLDEYHLTTMHHSEVSHNLAEEDAPASNLEVDGEIAIGSALIPNVHHHGHPFEAGSAATPVTGAHNVVHLTEEEGHTVKEVISAASETSPDSEDYEPMDIIPSAPPVLLPSEQALERSDDEDYEPPDAFPPSPAQATTSSAWNVVKWVATNKSIALTTAEGGPLSSQTVNHEQTEVRPTGAT